MSITIKIPSREITISDENICEMILANLINVVNNHKNIVCCKSESLYDYGIEGFHKDPNGRPVKKITFYVRECDKRRQ